MRNVVENYNIKLIDSFYYFSLKHNVEYNKIMFTASIFKRFYLIFI